MKTKFYKDSGTRNNLIRLKTFTSFEANKWKNFCFLLADKIIFSKTGK